MAAGAGRTERTWALVSARAEGISIRTLAAAIGLSPSRVHGPVRRPKISDRGETPGLTRDEVRLLAAARGHGSPRSQALLLLLGTPGEGLRINEALSRDIEHLGYDRGHRILRLERKGVSGR